MLGYIFKKEEYGDVWDEYEEEALDDGTVSVSATGEEGEAYDVAVVITKMYS